MANYITTKYGTRINVTGLSPEQVNRVRSVAEDKGAYGTKGAALADSFRKQNTTVQGGQPQVPGSTTQQGAPAATGGLTDRQRQRLQWLLKNRPNDPQVAKLQAIAKGAAPPEPDSPENTGGDGGADMNVDVPVSGDQTGVDPKTGAIDPDKATPTVTGAAEDDTRKTFEMMNPGSQTDIYGNKQDITFDPETGKTSINQTGGQAFQGAQGAFMNSLGGFQQRGPLNLQGDIQGLQGKAMNLGGDINSLRQQGPLDLSGDMGQLRSQGPLNLSQYRNDLQSSGPLNFGDERGMVQGGKLDLSGAPQILQTGDVRSDAERAADANYQYITKTYQRDKAREMEAAKQELANRGIPLDPGPNSLYGKTLAAIDEKYQGLDDQAKNQAISKSNETLGSLLSGQNLARSSFLQGAGMQHEAGLQDVNTLSGFKGQEEASRLNRFGALTGAAGQEDTSRLNQFGALTGAAGQQDASRLAQFGALTGAQQAQHGADVQDFGAITAARGTEHAQGLQDLTSLTGVTNSFNPTFTAFQGGQSNIAPNLQQIISTMSGADLAKYGIDKDAWMKKYAVDNQKTGGGSSGGGGGSSVIIGGSAPGFGV